MATGGIAFNGTTQYLEWDAGTMPFSTYPVTLLCYVSRAGTTGNAQYPFNAVRRSGDRGLLLEMNAAGTSKSARVYNTGGGGASATKSTTPDPSSTDYTLYVAVFNSTTDRTVYFGSDTGVQNTTSVSDEMSLLNRLNVSGFRWNDSASAAGFVSGSICECHVYTSALSASNVTSILAGTDPIDISGWVDGWRLSSNTDLTSIGGTRTFTALNSPTTSSLTLPTFSGGGSSTTPPPFPRFNYAILNH